MTRRCALARRAAPVLLLAHCVAFCAGAANAAAVSAMGTLPLRFEPNLGQAEPEVRYLARGRGYTVFLSEGAAILAFAPPREQANGRGQAVRLRFLNSLASSPVEGVNPLPGRSNYFLGNNPARWRTNVPTYSRVRYRGVYPGIDLIYYGVQGRLKYDLVISPGAEAGIIDIQYDGVQKLSVDTDGSLVLQTAGGELRQLPPITYQETASGRKPVVARYVLRGPQRVGFQVDPYDRSLPLIIDPILSFSTYLGGAGFDEGVSLTVDSSRNSYITGWTTSLNFPVTGGVFQPSFGGGSGLGDAFVAKLDPTGSSLLYSTYLGGNAEESGWSVAVDSSGSAYVTGNTRSANFPVTAAGYQRVFGGGSEYGDAFAAKLNPFGSSLEYATYLGGSGSERGLGISVDLSGSAYVGGVTASANFPVTPGSFQTALGGLKDCFLTKLNPAGTALVFSTYIGGSGHDWPNGIAIDATGSAYLAGYTQSPNYPITPGAFSSAFGSGPGDTFVTKVAPTGQSLAYSTYIGGSGDEFLRSIAVDAAGNAHVAGVTASPNYPTTPGAFQSTRRGNADVIVTKLNPAGSALLYSTLIGGSGHEQAEGIAVDASGVAHVTGLTRSTNFPLTPDAFYSFPKGGDEGFLTKVSPSGDSLVFSTYFGGTNNDLGIYVAVDDSNATYLLGFTKSADLFVTPGVIQPTLGGGTGDNFIARIDPTVSCTYTLSSLGQAFPSGGGTGFVTVTTGPNCPWAAANGTSWTAITSASSFVGGNTVTYSVSPNGGAGSRSAIIVIANQNFSITQAGTSCAYAISPSSQQFGNAGGTGSITVTASAGCPWTAVSNAPWITVTSGASGAGNGSVGFSVDAAAASRSGSITVAGRTFTVNQGAFAPIRVNAGGPAYTDSFGRVWSADTGYTGGAAFVTSAAVNGTPDPLLYRSVRYAPGNPGGSVQYRFTVPNGAYLVRLKFAETWFTQAGRRLFDVAVNGQQVLANFDILSQAGGPRLPVDRLFAVNVTAGEIALSFTNVVENAKINAIEIFPDLGVRLSLNPARVTLSVSQTQAFTGSVTGSANSAVTWSLSPASGAGSVSPAGVYTAPSIINSAAWAALTAIPSADPNLAETAVITLAPGCSFTLSPLSQSFGLPGGSSSVSVTAPTGCAWTAEANDLWISITGGASGSGSGVVSYNVASTTAARSGSMTIAGMSFAVSQAGFTPIRVNAGGPTYTDTLGRLWAADNSYVGGAVYTAPGTVNGTPDPTLYRSERYAPGFAGGSMRYQFAVPDGSYQVTLRFAETWFTTAGQRLMNVAVNGQQVLTNFDILAEAGGPRLPVDRSFPVTVTSGQIVVVFTNVLENAKVCAIEVAAP